MAVAVLSEAVPKRTDRARYHLHPSRPEGHCLEMTLSRSSGADTVDRRRSLTARFRARMLRRDADHRACRCVTTVARFSSIPATMRKLRMTMIEAWKPADSAEWVVRAQWSSGWSGSWWSDVVGGQSRATGPVPTCVVQVHATEVLQFFRQRHADCLIVIRHAH